MSPKVRLSLILLLLAVISLSSSIIDPAKVSRPAPNTAEPLLQQGYLTSRLCGHVPWDHRWLHNPHFQYLIGLGLHFLALMCTHANTPPVRKRERVSQRKKKRETQMKRVVWGRRLISRASSYPSCRHLSPRRDRSALIGYMKASAAVPNPNTVAHLSSAPFTVT